MTTYSVPLLQTHAGRPTASGPQASEGARSFKKQPMCLYISLTGVQNKAVPFSQLNAHAWIAPQKPPRAAKGDHTPRSTQSTSTQTSSTTTSSSTQTPTPTTQTTDRMSVLSDVGHPDPVHSPSDSETLFPIHYYKGLETIEEEDSDASSSAGYCSRTDSRESTSRSRDTGSSTGSTGSRSAMVHADSNDTNALYVSDSELSDARSDDSTPSTRSLASDHRYAEKSSKRSSPLPRSKGFQQLVRNFAEHATERDTATNESLDDSASDHPQRDTSASLSVSSTVASSRRSSSALSTHSISDSVDSLDSIADSTTSTTSTTSSRIAALMVRFKTHFTAACKRYLPFWETHTNARLQRTQRTQAAEMALDKINTQAGAILHALRKAPDALAEARHARGKQPSRTPRAETIQGPARDTLLREGRVTFDLARQLSLDSLLSEADRSAHPFTSTFDLDAVATLETAGRLTAAQRTFLYGLDTIQESLSLLRGKLKGSNGKMDPALKHTFRQTRDTLSDLVYLQREAHDTLTAACVHAQLTPAERSAIFNDRTVAQLMEATAGAPESLHDRIAMRLVEAARRSLEEERIVA